MIPISNKLYSQLGLFFIFLSLLGYQLATSLFIPLTSNVAALSTTVTYPYRALVGLLAVVLIVFRPKNAVSVPYSQSSRLSLIFFFIYFLRIFIDIYVRDIYLQPGFRKDVILCVLFSMIPSVWATARCAAYIDYEKLNKYLLWGGVLLLVLFASGQTALISAEYNEMTRIDANVALNSIGLGHSCLSVFLILLYWFLKNNRMKLVQKAFLIVAMFMSLLIMLRAASRGPVVAFLAIVLFFVYSKTRYKIVGAVISVILIIVLVTSMDSLLALLEDISPMMNQRLSAAIYENDSSGRNSLSASALEVFLRNPFLGDRFVLDMGFYSHNSFLDVMIGLGLFGAFVYLYLIVSVFKKAYYNIHNMNAISIISLLSVQMILKSMFSGAIYTDNVFAICMIIVLSTQGIHTIPQNMNNTSKKLNN